MYHMKMKQTNTLSESPLKMAANNEHFSYAVLAQNRPTLFFFSLF